MSSGAEMASTSPGADRLSGSKVATTPRPREVLLPAVTCAPASQIDGPRAAGTRLRPPRPARLRTRRRQLQRWGQKYAAVIEALDETLNEAVTAMSGAVQALAEPGGAPHGGEAARRASDAAQTFLAAIAAAQGLPPVPDPAARPSFSRTLTLWRTGAELNLASLRPFDADECVRAANILGEGADEFSRFALFFISGGQ